MTGELEFSAIGPADLASVDLWLGRLVGCFSRWFLLVGAFFEVVAPEILVAHESRSRSQRCTLGFILAAERTWINWLSFGRQDYCLRSFGLFLAARQDPERRAQKDSKSKEVHFSGTAFPL